MVVVLEQGGEALIEGRQARAQIGFGFRFGFLGGGGLPLLVAHLFEQLRGAPLGLLRAQLERAGALLAVSADDFL